MGLRRYKPMPGALFENVLREAKEMAVKEKVLIYIIWQDKTIYVDQNSDCELLHRDFWFSEELSHPVIGPGAMKSISHALMLKYQRHKKKYEEEMKLLQG